MTMNNIIQTTLLSFLLGGVANATETPANWWQSGSYAYPETDELLTHFSGTVGYRYSDGNEENSNLRISTLAVLRKGHFSFVNMYRKSKWSKKVYANKNLPPKKLSNDYHSIESNIFYDINSYFFGAVGYENGRNLEMAIYNKNVRYGGIGVRALQSKKHKLNLFVGYGDEDISYEIYRILPAGKTNLIYYQFNYLWTVNDNLSLSSNYTLLDADMEYRNTSKLIIKANTKISKYLSLDVSYQDLSIEALDTVSLFTHDKSISTSLKISF